MFQVDVVQGPALLSETLTERVNLKFVQELPFTGADRMLDREVGRIVFKNFLKLEIQKSRKIVRLKNVLVCRQVMHIQVNYVGPTV